MCVFSVQDCLKQQGEQSSDCTTTAVRPKNHQDQEPCALGKLTDHPEATVYVKSFEGRNFRGFLLTTNVLPLKIWCCPLTSQSMVPPGLKFSMAKVFPTY